MILIKTLFNIIKHLKTKFQTLDKLDAKITTLTDEQAEYIGVGKNGPFKKDTYRY